MFSQILASTLRTCEFLKAYMVVNDEKLKERYPNT